jgi:hypothetical protein
MSVIAYNRCVDNDNEEEGEDHTGFTVAVASDSIHDDYDG